MVLQDPDTSKRILIQRSHRVGPTGAWKGSRSLIQRSCTSDPTGPWCKWFEIRKILVQFWILMQRSSASGPTGSWHKWSYRILIQVVHKGLDTGILRQRSCTSGSTKSWYKCSERILIQRSCTSATTGSWYKWSKRILIQRSCYKCRADLPSLLVGVHSHTHTHCLGSLAGIIKWFCHVSAGFTSVLVRSLPGFASLLLLPTSSKIRWMLSSVTSLISRSTTSSV